MTRGSLERGGTRSVASSTSLGRAPRLRSGRRVDSDFLQFALIEHFGAADPLPFGKQAGAGDVVEFDADAVGVLEQDRIIAGRPRLFLWPMDEDDVAAVLQEGIEAVRRVGVATQEGGMDRKGVGGGKGLSIRDRPGGRRT